MPFCAACGAEAGDAARFCARCGRALAVPEASRTPAMDATGADPVDVDGTRLGPPTPWSSPAAPPTPRTSPPSWPAAGGSRPAEARFAPGTVLLDRYRIVGLLGRGGMGEVYRADDLRLDQPVALKFLPDVVADDPARLSQFHNEVRVARQVTHKNVCRMYDLGEIDGRPFLSMEYVDGENLATLLRRIGRLPGDKAVEMARQLCAGLAAAHQRGVLHRDLKPANVMVDGEGHVRLTDFGIAGTADQVIGSREGTPGYMAPEQLAEGRVSVQSDLFSLGLVLYEMFTGRRGIEAKTIDELLALHERGLDLSTTATQPDVDPAIDRVIRRCLARSPADRPTSALAVSAALLGGDPLAAALAAGETPSPEMVAAAGRTDAVPAAVAVSLLAAFAVGLGALLWFAADHQLIRRVPFDRPPEVLADRARTIAESLGYTTPPLDRAWGFVVRDDVMRYLRTERQGADRWDVLSDGRLAAVAFYYRTSPRRLVPMRPAARPFVGDPPLLISGMVSMLLDTEGRLVQFAAVPPQRDAAAAGVAAPAPDWGPLIQAAGFDPAQLAEAAPEWTPPVFADARAAWTTPAAGPAGASLRLEAAAYRGQPVAFNVVGPWTRAGRMEAPPQTTVGRAAVAASAGLLLLMLAAAGVMARNNLRSGRGDRAGAARLALVVIATGAASWVVGAHHVGDVAQEVNQFFIALALALLNAAIIWVAYLALEPVVRRRWPTGMISWTRVLAGRWRDPLVGRDVLIGLVAGVGFALAVRAASTALTWAGVAPGAPTQVNVEGLTGVPVLLGLLLTAIVNVLTTALAVVLLFVVIRLVVRWPPLAFAVLTVVLTLLLGAELIAGEMPALEIAFALMVAAMLAAVAWHFGLLAFGSMLLVNQAIFAGPLIADAGAWYAPQAMVVIGLLTALAVGAFVVSRAGQPLFGKRLLEP